MAAPAELVTTDRTVGSTRLARLIRGVSHFGGPEQAADPERRPAYRALAHSVRSLILDGRIALRTRVPAERDLAAALGMSRTTVTAAYDLLREDGFLESRRGSGTWTMLPPGSGPNGYGGWLMPSEPGSADVAIDLSCASFGLSAELLGEALAESGPALAALAGFTGYYQAGLPELRELIAERYCERGLHTTPDQIVITSGAQHGNVLALSLLCGPGDRVVVESPTYPNSVEAMRRARLRPVPVPVGDDGIESDVLAAQLRQAVPRVAYLIADFHNPTGTLMSFTRRAEAAEAARAAGTWIINDETVTDMALDVPAPPPFPASVSKAAAEQVLSVGSMSKSHWGGLRIGWIRASARMATELAGHWVSMDMAGRWWTSCWPSPCCDAGGAWSRNAGRHCAASARPWRRRSPPNCRSGPGARRPAACRCGWTSASRLPRCSPTAPPPSASAWSAARSSVWIPAPSSTASASPTPSPRTPCAKRSAAWLPRTAAKRPCHRCPRKIVGWRDPP